MNPKNQRSANSNYSKCTHDAHDNDEREHKSGNNSFQDTPRSPEFSNGELSARATALPIKNFLSRYSSCSQEEEDGRFASRVPRKALVSLGSDTKRQMSLNFAMDDLFSDDVSMDLFIQTIRGQTNGPGLDVHNGKTNAFFN